MVGCMKREHVVQRKSENLVTCVPEIWEEKLTIFTIEKEEKGEVKRSVTCLEEALLETRSEEPEE